MSVNNDSVTRSAYYKYLHPKEVFIAEGVLVPDIARKKVSWRLYWLLRIDILIKVPLTDFHPIESHPIRRCKERRR
jgi:hypothetical protein